MEKQEKETIHCQDCGGTEKVNTICSSCIEKIVLNLLQRENINPVRRDK